LAKDFRYQDTSVHNVAIAKRIFDEKASNSYWPYFAEAEYYFDCEVNWQDWECNGRDNAAYSINWRARLRRVQPMDWQKNVQKDIDKISGFLAPLENLQSYPEDDFLKNVLRVKDGTVRQVIEMFTGDLFRQAENEIAAPVKEVVDPIQDAVDDVDQALQETVPRH
jgi:hypothetical protein